MPRYILNPQTLEYEVHEEPKSLKYLRLAGFVALAVVCVGFNFWLYVSVLGKDLPRTAHLKREHAEWESKVEVLNRRLDIYDRTLVGIEQRDGDVYRSIYGLSPIPESVKNSGLGGARRYDALGASGAGADLMVAVHHIDNLIKRTYVQSKALDETGQVSRQAGDMISSVPSVPPLNPDRNSVRLSSPYGYRTDPVYGGGEYHRGQDFATARGVPVYVTGDGVVESVNYRFSGYGNEVIVNHGFGYKTRYAHLNSIEVAAGMKVSRGDRIATVGSTGKSTGPHLHYEVIYRNAAVNPMLYMDFNMPVDEYRAMIMKRGADSARDRQSSTMELLRRMKSNGGNG